MTEKPSTQRLYKNEIFHVRRSVKYHDLRRRFFDNVLNVSLFLALASGPAFVFLSGASPSDSQAHADWVKYLPAVITSVFAGLALIAKAGTKSNLHNELKSDFIRLRQDMERGRHDENMTEQDIANWTARRLDIETREPPINRVIDGICHNEVIQSMGIKTKTQYVRVLRGHRIVGPFTRAFDPGLRRYKKDEKAPSWMVESAPSQV